MFPSNTGSPKVPRLVPGAEMAEYPRPGSSQAEDIVYAEVPEARPGGSRRKVRERHVELKNAVSGASNAKVFGESSSRSAELNNNSVLEVSADSNGTEILSQTGSDLEWNTFTEDARSEQEGAQVPPGERNMPEPAESPADSPVVPRSKFKRLPRIEISPGLGSLVEKFESDCPAVKITNLYDMKYEVQEMLDYKATRTGSEFHVRWKGWSEKHNSWQEEYEIQASPALRLHIASFFAERANQKKAWEYLREYVRNAVVENEKPDKFLMSRLTNHELEVLGRHVIPPNGVVLEAMRRTIESRLKSRSHHELLEAFEDNFLDAVKFMHTRLKALHDYEQWRHRIQKSEPGAKIKIENLHDCEKLPQKFCYITDYDFAEEVEMRPRAKWCTCTTTSCFASECCGYYQDSETSDVFRAYDTAQRLTRDYEKTHLFECNYSCKCDLRCENRVTQRGLQVPLTIFRTATAEWRVKAGAPLENGTFVGEYFGEYIPIVEARVRDPAHLLQVTPWSPFDDQVRPPKYAIDGARQGNITHFFNRSKDPNLGITYVFVNSHNEDAPRVAFFAVRDIAEGEELSFDPDEVPRKIR